MVFGCVFSVWMLNAQDTLQFSNMDMPDTVHRIEMLAMYSEGEVRLRWAPNHAADWYALILNGYRVEKYEMDREHYRVIPETRQDFEVRPWPVQEFKPFMETDEAVLLMAGQCMHGEWESMQSGTLNFAARQDELNNRYGIAMFAADTDWDAALALGLGFTDKDVKHGAQYFYKVFPADTSVHVLNAYTSILTVDGQVPPPIIERVIEHEGTVTLQWDRLAHEAYYSGYYIERSGDGKTFNRLLDLPFVGGVTEEYPSQFFSFTDTVENYTPYTYRIIGITPFATLSAPSPSMRGMGRDKTPAGRPGDIDVTCDATTAEVLIKWEAPVEADLEGFRVFRSGRIDGYYVDVSTEDLDDRTTAFREFAADQWTRQYYKVASVDTAGNLNYTLPFLAAFRDTVAPEKPVGLSGTIDSTGVVTLIWNKGTEKDLRGYFVYMSNQADQFFTNKVQRPWTDTIWRDTITLKTFTEKIYYKISAVDFHSHFSAFSDIVELAKPDTLPPFPPHITKYRVEKDHIRLEYSESRSKDVVAHVLRKRMGSGEWTEVPDFDIGDVAYLDRQVEPGNLYAYQLVAIDDAGLESRHADIVRVKAVDLSLPDPPMLTSCIWNDDGSITIEWTFDPSRATTCLVYRSVNDGPFTTRERVSGASTFTDKQVRKGQKYVYRLKTQWKDGRKSRFSEPISPKL